jgi:hypothetical protein
VIDHAEKYIESKVDANGLEKVWSLVKRAIHGTYLNIEPFHLLPLSRRAGFPVQQPEASDGQRFPKVAGSVLGKRLNYPELTGKGTIA